MRTICEFANIVDPDQTAPKGAGQSGSALFASAVLPEPLVFKILEDFLLHQKMSKFQGLYEVQVIDMVDGGHLKIDNDDDHRCCCY